MYSVVNHPDVVWHLHKRKQKALMEYRHLLSRGLCTWDARSKYELNRPAAVVPIEMVEIAHNKKIR